MISLLTHPFTGITLGEMQFVDHIPRDRLKSWHCWAVPYHKTQKGFERRDQTVSGRRVCPWCACASRADVACATLRQPQFNQHVPRQTQRSNVVMVRTDFCVSVNTTVRVRHKLRWIMYLGKTGLNRNCVMADLVI